MYGRFIRYSFLEDPLFLATFFDSKRRPRTTRPRVSTWWEDVVPTYSEEDFVDDFRMGRDLFTWLCNELRPSLSKDVLGGCPTFLRGTFGVTYKIINIMNGSGNYLRIAGRLLGVGVSTVREACLDVANALCAVLQKEAIRFPAMEDAAAWEAIQRGFSVKQNIDFVAGAIDGTHFAIKKPAGDALNNAYINRKGFASIACQAVVDADGLFRDVMVGWPGSVHDSRLLRVSSLGQRAEAGDLLPPGYFIIGDSGYALLDWLMIPYSTKVNQHARETNFNFLFSSTRIIVEQAFGRLKMRHS